MEAETPLMKLYEYSFSITIVLQTDYCRIYLTSSLYHKKTHLSTIKFPLYKFFLLGISSTKNLSERSSLPPAPAKQYLYCKANSK
jgi:hypothetical protein